MTQRSAAVDRWADSLATQPHIPKYLSSPGGAQYAGTAAVAIALTTADIRTHTAALQHAAAVHRTHTERLKQMTTADRDALDYLNAQLRPWIAAAKQQEARLLDALDAHAHATTQWREAAGRLLAEARATGDHDTVARVSGLDAAHRRLDPLPVAP